MCSCVCADDDVDVPRASVNTIGTQGDWSLLRAPRITSAGRGHAIVVSDTAVLALIC